ncbi:RES family NAD+ phosphorylase [Mesorhizobium newzealandense]|uniref:RES family NAD+ phosphorylase n=1 Tax=Mesorhizobium newzealandense TaxID=1300302 RepID=A0ABW4UDG3_9HYPH
MAKPKIGRGSRTSPVPVPSNNLQDIITRTIWPVGQVIHRIHLNLYAGAEFNPGLKGNARFSPIKNANGASIPTLYGGTTFDCAAMEPVFHDVPFAPGLKTYDKVKLADQVYSKVTPQGDFVLADLSVTALRKLGIKRSQIIDTEKDGYSATRPWAEAIHTQCPDIQGLCWVSRQDDRALAVMLFGDRIPANMLEQSGASLDLTGNTDVYSELLELADRIGVKIVGVRF